MEEGEVKGMPSFMGRSDTPDCLGRMEPLATNAHKSRDVYKRQGKIDVKEKAAGDCGGQARILPQPDFYICQEKC